MLAEDFKITQVAHVATVTVRVDALTLPVIQELIERMRSRYRCFGTTCFALDMRRVEFIDSACIGALVGFLREIAHIHGHIALVGCRYNVEFVFRITRLDTVFLLYDDLQKAVKDLTGE